MSFHQNDMTQVAEILPHVRPTYSVNSMAADVLARSHGIRNDDIDLVKPR